MKTKEDKKIVSNEQVIRLVSFIGNGYEGKQPDHPVLDPVTKETMYVLEGFHEQREFPLWLQCFYFITLFTGMRRNEVLALNWKDIDFDNQRINVSHSIKITKDGIVDSSLKNESSKRSIAVDPYIFALLKSLQFNENEQRNFYYYISHQKIEFIDNDHVFKRQVQRKHKYGELMNPNTPYHCLQKVIDLYNALIDRQVLQESDPTKQNKIIQQKFPTICEHDFRRTYLSILKNNGKMQIKIKKLADFPYKNISIEVKYH